MPRPWGHRLFAGIAATIVTASLLATLPTSTAVAAENSAADSETLVNIVNGNWAEAMLCASPDDNSVWIGDNPDAPYCQWEQIGNDGQFVFFSPAKGSVLTGGKDGTLSMSDPVFPTPDYQTFAWGEWEKWEARGLKWSSDQNLYVDGSASPPATGPTKSPVTMRGRRDGQEQQTTWNVKRTKPTPEVAQSVSAVYVMNGLWTDQMLCAAADATVRLSTDRTNPACQWLPFGSGNFVLYNPQYGKVITYNGGDRGPLVMDHLAYPTVDHELFSLGSREGWEANALRWAGDIGQNVDAGWDNPTTGPVHTRGWDTHRQRQLTWNFVPVIRPTALVTLGDSFMSGEAGRWRGNSNYPLTGRDGTDRAYTGWQTYDPSIVYGSSYANGCNRSDSSEAHSSDLMQVQINLACSGATTANIFRAADGGQPFKGEEPQADQLAKVALRYDVRLIALSIGGNDLGFSDIIKACIKTYTTGGKPCYNEQQGIVIGKLGATQKNVMKAIDEIRKTMEEAGYADDHYQIVLQSAPSPLPGAKDIRYPEGTWERWHTGGCPIWDADADWARYKLVGEISNLLRSVADAEGVGFLDLQDAMSGREVCSVTSELVTSKTPPSEVTSEWARFLVSGTAQGQQQESFHPNYYGQRALGRCLDLFEQIQFHQATCTNTPGEGPEGMRLDEIW